jgi:hypothetical protein
MKRKLTLTAATAAVMLAFGGQAQAGALTQSILDITNFTVTIPTTGVIVTGVSNDGTALASLNGATVGAVQPATTGPVTLTVCEPSVPGCPMHTPGTVVTPPATGDFAISTANLSGVAAIPPGANALTDNVVSLQSNGTGAATSKLGLVATFVITVTGAPATISFSDNVRTSLLAQLDAGSTGTANALIGWSLTLVPTAGGSSFVFAPNGVVDAAGETADDCNQNTNVGVLGTGPLIDTKTCTGRFAASATLGAGSYTATITHTGSAAAAIPAPGTLALLAGGLLGLGWVGRRRNS